MKWFIALIPVTVFSGPIEDYELAKAEAEAYVHRLYLSQAVEDFCTVRPDGVYHTTFRGMPVEVECEIRNKWVDLHRRKKTE